MNNFYYFLLGTLGGLRGGSTIYQANTTKNSSMTRSNRHNMGGVCQC